jgi:hypothetical protein
MESLSSIPGFPNAHCTKSYPCTSFWCPYMERSTVLSVCKIWGFHGGDYEECRLPPKRRLTKYLQDAISQKTAFFVISVGEVTRLPWFDSRYILLLFNNIIAQILYFWTLPIVLSSTRNIFLFILQKTTFRRLVLKCHRHKRLDLINITATAQVWHIE